MSFISDGVLEDKIWSRCRFSPFQGIQYLCGDMDYRWQWGMSAVCSPFSPEIGRLPLAWERLKRLHPCWGDGVMSKWPISNTHYEISPTKFSLTKFSLTKFSQKLFDTYHLFGLAATKKK